jgi:signal transduction histidine kinase
MNSAYEDVRNLSHNLLPKELAERGLVGAIQKLKDDLNSLNKIKVIFIHKGVFENLKDSIAFELYSICLELVNNAFKYSNANQININLCEQNNKILFNIEDDGIGLEKIKEGMGLTNIRKRVESVNGDLQVIKYRKGCEFKITLDV